jgi:hypothetical protein
MPQRKRLARTAVRSGGAVAVAVVLGWAVQAWAQQPAPSEENTLKAAFVFNFAKYTEWPEPLWGKSTTLSVCVAGPRDGFAQAVAALDAKPPLRDRQIEVRTVARAEDASGCHVLVFAGRQKMPEWLRGLRNAPALTVGDSDGFAAGGGVIGFYVEGEKLRFEINQDVAQRAGLRLSSQMLKLARLVKDATPREP